MVPIEILFAVHLKHTSFWPSGEVKPVQKDLVHAMPLQCMFALFICLIQSLWVEVTETGKHTLVYYSMKLITTVKV